MGLRINLNIASLIAQQNLRRINKRLDTAFQQVSSGERINSAGDDPAGLAVSQLLRSQVRSLDQAVRNSGDGQSVIDTAESALGNLTDMVQRIRELAIQAANDSNGTENRVAMQTEIDQLIEEFNRIGNTLQFNGKNLLDGSFVNQRIQTGIAPGDYLPVSIGDMRANVLGQQAIVTGLDPVSSTAIAGGGDLIINGIEVGASDADGVSFVAADASAIAKAAAINRVASRSGVSATVEASVHEATGASVGPVTLDGTASALFINGVNIGPVTVEAGDATGALRDAINTHSGETGVTASLGASGELVLTAEDGRNFQITTAGSVADDLGLAVADGDLTAQIVSGRIRLTSSQTINLAGTDIGLIGFTGAQTLTVVDPSTALASISVTTGEDAENAISTADAALAQLNRVRASLGAISNRLEEGQQHAQAAAENLRASDSRIRDTDFAEATARMTQQQILQQAATAILAQANLLPSMALQLLQK
jgi:flagellin